jgi:hypothetical protein
MKYQESLDQKGLKVEQLSTTLQKRIQEIHAIDEKINKMKDDGVDDEVKDELEIYVRTLKQLDDEVSKSILKFDLMKFQARKEVLDRNREKRLIGNEQPIEKPVEVKSEKPIEQKVEELKKEVVIQPEKFIEEEQEEEQEEYAQQHQEDIEFDKKATVKQKKGSTALIIMGIGAFILTWGAVNFFKERR